VGADHELLFRLRFAIGALHEVEASYPRKERDFSTWLGLSYAHRIADRWWLGGVLATGGANVFDPACCVHTDDLGVVIGLRSRYDLSPRFAVALELSPMVVADDGWRLAYLQTDLSLEARADNREPVATGPAPIDHAGHAGPAFEVGFGAATWDGGVAPKLYVGAGYAVSRRYKLMLRGALRAELDERECDDGVDCSDQQHVIAAMLDAALHVNLEQLWFSIGLGVGDGTETSHKTVIAPLRIGLPIAPAFSLVSELIPWLGEGIEVGLAGQLAFE